MTDTVTIFADVAREIAADLRLAVADPTVRATPEQRATYTRWADLLDPRPTLREQVASMVGAAINAAYPTMTHDAPEHDDHWAGVILADVRDAIAALPCLGGPSVADDNGPVTSAGYRAAVLDGHTGGRP